MKKTIVLLLLGVMLFTAACESSPTDHTTPSSVPDTTANGFEVLTPGSIYSTVTPPDPGEGVWYVATEEELAAIDLESCTGVPVICITAPIVFSEPFVLRRPVTLYYYAAETEADRFSGAGILISTREAGQIRIVSTSDALIDAGFLTVDAPLCDLVWEGDSIPNREDFTLYCNTKTVNGESNDTLGGTAETLSDIVLINSETGKPYEGSCFTVRGNVIDLGCPLLASDSDIYEATVCFTVGSAYQELSVDLGENPVITLTDSAGIPRTYLLTARRLSYGLPVMQIYTENGKGIYSKDHYVNGTVYIDGDAYSTQIKGRGNSSWSKFPKKSYRIKLESGEPLFGLPDNRDWVLVPNYNDKSLIRNCVAHSIAATLDGLEFTPTHIPVNLYLNGQYLGIYTFADKIEAGSGRLDLSAREGDIPSAFDGQDLGFLIEIGWDYSSENVYARDFFDARKVERMYVKEPEITSTYSRDMVNIMEYIFDTEDAILMNRNWEDYIDLDSWVDWFLVTELTFNTESVFYRSCYLWKREGGKLQMGPVWDFDTAFGNHSGDLYGYNGWCTTESTYHYLNEENWMDYLLCYDTFNDAVKLRWNTVKDDLLESALSAVNRYRAALEGSQQQNFLRWDILDAPVGAAADNSALCADYDSQIQYLTDFIRTRWAYMDERINREF